MGKKTKKNGKKKGEKGAKNINAEIPAAPPTSSTPPDGAECWICLEQDDSASNNRLERDCSCRAAAGFAHFNCLLKYVKDKSESMYAAGDRIDFAKPWTVCPNCNQTYTGRLAIKLAKSLMDE